VLQRAFRPNSYCRLNCAEQVPRRRSHLDVRSRAHQLCLPAVGTSPEGNDDPCKPLRLNLLDCPPASASRKLGLDQRQVWMLASRRFDDCLSSVHFGHDLEAFLRAKHGDQRLAYFG